MLSFSFDLWFHASAELCKIGSFRSCDCAAVILLGNEAL